MRILECFFHSFAGHAVRESLEKRDASNAGAKTLSFRSRFAFESRSNEMKAELPRLMFYDNCVKILYAWCVLVGSRGNGFLRIIDSALSEVVPRQQNIILIMVRENSGG